MTTKELLAQLNAQREAQGKPPLAAWKQSREKLEDAIAQGHIKDVRFEVTPGSIGNDEDPRLVPDPIAGDAADMPDGGGADFEMPEGELVRLPEGPEPHPELEGRLLHVLGERFASCYDLLLASEMPDSQYLPATSILVELEKQGVARSHVHDGECDWALTPEELARRAAEEAPPADVATDLVGRPPRGAVKQMVNAMLETDAPYEDIVAAVKEAHPTAKTTARSIASMAMDLRRQGVAIPSRRKQASVG